MSLFHSAKVKVVVGPPGTGKTTHMIEAIRALLRQGVSPARVGVFAFTRNAAHEAADRISKDANFSPQLLQYVRTLHSMVFRELGVDRQDMMTGQRLQAFAAHVGEVIEENRVLDIDEGDTNSVSPGTVMLYVDNLARTTEQSLQEVWERFGDARISWEKQAQFSRDLAEYKRDNFLYDFTDILQRFCEQRSVPPLHYVFVDEAQDLTPLQWKVVTRLSEHAHGVYITGDDDQAIFTWAGAEPDRLIRLSENPEVTLTVLKQSYRLNPAVFDLSQTVVRRISERIDKTWQPLRKPGEVNFITGLEHLDFSKGQWLILTRHRRDVSRCVAILQEKGLHYSVPGHESQRSVKLRQAMNTFVRLSRDLSITSADAANFYAHMAPGHGTRKESFPPEFFKTRKHAAISRWQLVNEFGFVGSLRVVDLGRTLDLVSAKEVSRYQEILERGEDILHPRILVSTIHHAKGSEAENVVVVPDVNRTVYKKVYDSDDDEHRVWYVAATRAKTNLWICEPRGQYFYSYPSMERV